MCGGGIFRKVELNLQRGSEVEWKNEECGGLWERGKSGAGGIGRKWKTVLQGTLLLHMTKG